MPFNPEMIVLARDLRGMTQQQLADESKLSQGYISQMESGLREGTQEAIEACARALRLPVSFFSQEESYTGFGITMVYYRKKQSAQIGHLRRLQAEVTLRRMHVKRLLRGVDVKAKHEFPFFDIVESGGTPEAIASQLRASWMLPIGPVRNLVTAIEGAGGIVFKFPFGTSDIDAMSQWPDDCPPLFFVNSQSPADRTRFSLAHELGHIVMHKTATEEVEPEADRFASEFLMPKHDIAAQLIGMDLKKAAAMKPHWRVSMASIIKRARDLGKLTEGQYRSLYIRLGELGFRKKESGPISPEEPTIIPRIIDIYMREHGYGMDELGTILRWPQDEIAARYLPTTGMRMAQ